MTQTTCSAVNQSGSACLKKAAANGFCRDHDADSDAPHIRTDCLHRNAFMISAISLSSFAVLFLAYLLSANRSASPAVHELDILVKVEGVPCLTHLHDAHLEHFFVTGGVIPPNYRAVLEHPPQQREQLCRSGRSFLNWAHSYLLQPVEEWPVDVSLQAAIRDLHHSKDEDLELLLVGSNRIEGSQLSWLHTLDVVQYVELFKNNTNIPPASVAMVDQIPKAELPYVDDAEQHLRAWHDVTRWVAGSRVTPATSELDHVLDLDRILIHHELEKLPGSLRIRDIYVTNSFLLVPVPEELPTIMNLFLQWVHESSQQMSPIESFSSSILCSDDSHSPTACARHPAVFAAMLHLNFAHLHPFTDGNGRMSRLLLNWALLALGLPPTVIRSNHVNEYRRALRLAGRQSHYELKQAPNALPFVLFVLKELLETVREFDAEISRAMY